VNDVSMSLHGRAPAAGVEIAAARCEDIDEVFRIRVAVEHNHLSMQALAARGITPDWTRHLLREGILAIWCAWAPGPRMAGFCAVNVMAREIFGLFVAPSCQGEGVGSALLASAVEALAARGVGALSLATGRGTPAHGFYLRRGWVEVGDGSVAGDVALRYHLRGSN
jgi:GNAT superfamily N-acetyltransferase